MRLPRQGRSSPRGVVRISSDGDERTGAKINPPSPPKKTRASNKPTKIPRPKVTPQNNLVPRALFPGFGGEAGKAFSFSRLTSKAREKRNGDEVAPQKTYAEFSRLKNFQRALKFGCTLFAELLGWDRRALPRII